MAKQTPAAARRKPLRFFRAAAVLAGLVMGLLLAELLLRLCDIRPERYGPPHMRAWNGTAFVPTGGSRGGAFKNPSRYEALGCRSGEYVPGTRFKFYYTSNARGYFDGENSVEYVINGEGMRGPEVTREKPAGIYRILGIGDSFAFGQGVWEQDTYLRRLEKNLNQANAVGCRVEVLNAGVIAYNTRDEVIYLEHQWLDFQPDFVLLQFYLNDAYSEMTFARLIYGHLQTAPSALARRSYLCDLLESGWKVGGTRREIEQFYRGHYLPGVGRFQTVPGDGDIDWSVCRTSLAHAVELCRQRNIGIALVLFPEFYHLKRDYPFGDIHRLVMSTAAELGLPALDLLNIYRGHDDRQYWAHPTDHHPNERAHAEAALAIEKFLIDKRLLGTCAPAKIPGPESKK